MPPPTNGFVAQNGASEHPDVEDDFSHLPAPPPAFELVPAVATTPSWPEAPEPALIEEVPEVADATIEPETEPGSESTPQAGLPDAGWFPDHSDETQERYWTGREWAEQWRPVESAADPATPTTFTPPGHLEVAGGPTGDPEPAAVPPADWYADPEDPSRQRYWDGQTWTNHFHPPLT